MAVELSKDTQAELLPVKHGLALVRVEQSLMESQRVYLTKSDLKQLLAMFK